MGGSVAERVGAALGTAVTGTSRLAGGCVGDVRLCELSDGSRVVAKVADGARGTLDVEGYMLRELRRLSELPVPEVYHDEASLLVMEFVENDGGRSDRGEAQLADLLADLHGVTSERFGFERDTLIGPLAQVNTWGSSWVEFFGEHRLIAMARMARDAGQISASCARRVGAIAERLRVWIEEPESAGLVHGDCWSGNVLWNAGRVATLIDPAVCFADPEIELAFIDLMGGVGRTFWDRYAERRPIRDGFWEERRDLYNLYPLLVHARLFGGGYVGSVEAILGRFGD